jgi:hypothetical protein
MHELVVNSPIWYMGACTTIHTPHQSQAGRPIHTTELSVRLTNHDDCRPGRQAQREPNTTPCIISTRLRGACMAPPSRFNPTGQPITPYVNVLSKNQLRECACGTLGQTNASSHVRAPQLRGGTHEREHFRRATRQLPMQGVLLPFSFPACGPH